MLPGEAIAESGMGQGALLSVVDRRVERHKRPAPAVFMRFDPGKTSPPPSGIPLNEGRGANPGDTTRRRPLRWVVEGAQRRPGREPRRHAGRPYRAMGCSVRSTKAGARTPAIRRRAYAAARAVAALNEGRGANPGDTPGLGRHRAAPAALNEGRGANPGDTPGLGRHRAAPAALNEGRGANPGDTEKVRA